MKTCIIDSRIPTIAGYINRHNQFTIKEICEFMKLSESYIKRLLKLVQIRCNVKLKTEDVDGIIYYVVSNKSLDLNKKDHDLKVIQKFLNFTASSGIRDKKIKKIVEIIKSKD